MDGSSKGISSKPIFRRTRSFMDTGQSRMREAFQNKFKGSLLGKSKQSSNVSDTEPTISMENMGDVTKNRPVSTSGLLGLKEANGLNLSEDTFMAKLRPVVISGLPVPKKTTHLPRWSTSTYANGLEQTPYHVACESLWARDFIILPKSRKVRLARRASFSRKFRSAFTMLLQTDPALMNNSRIFINDAPHVKATAMDCVNVSAEQSVNLVVKTTMDPANLCDLLSIEDIEMADHAGWMVDLSCNNNSGVGSYRGITPPTPARRCWCVLADMLLCVFADNTSDKPIKVIMLPGLEVKAIVYKSAHHQVVPHPGSPACCNGGALSTDPFSEKASTTTISGMLRYQILLSDPCLGAEYVFGLEKQSEVDQWVTLLKVAVNLDIDVFADTSDDEDQDAAETTLGKDGELLALQSFNGNFHSRTFDSLNSLLAATTRTNGDSQCTDDANGTLGSPETSAPRATTSSSSRTKGIPRRSHSPSPKSRSESPSRIPRLQRSSSSPSDTDSLLRRNKSTSYLPSPRTHPHRPVRVFSCDMSNDSGVSTALGSAVSKDSVFDEAEVGLSYPKLLPGSGANSIGSAGSLTSDTGSESVIVSRSVDGAIMKLSTKKSVDAGKPSNKQVQSGDSEVFQMPSSPFMSLLRKARGRTASLSSSERADINNGSQSNNNNRQRNLSTSSSASTSSGASHGKSTLGLRAKLVRKASTIKVRVFGSTGGPKIQQGEVKLGSLKDVKISGNLSVKNILKWTNFWCVVSGGTLYTFCTQSPSDTPELALPLRDCTVQLASNDKGKKHLFKVSHLTTRSIHFAAKDNIELSKWVFTLKREGKASSSSSSSTPRSVSVIEHSEANNGVENSSRINNLMGSQLSLDSSVSVQSQGSALSRVSLMSEHSTTSSLSSLSQQSGLSSVASSGGSPIVGDQTAPFGAEIPTSIPKNSARDNIQNMGQIPKHVSSGEKGLESCSSSDCVPQQADCHAHGSASIDTSVEDTDKRIVRSGSPKSVQSRHSADFSMVCPQKNGLDKVGAIRILESPNSDSKIAMSSIDSKHLTRSLQNVTVSLSAKYSTSTKNNLQQSWRNDKTYQLHLLKAKISTLPDRPAIFNRHLPGPNNEGLLMMTDGHSSEVIVNGHPSDKTNNHVCDDLLRPRALTEPTEELEDETITRKPSTKIKRRFSLKRVNSVRETRPKYSPKAQREFESEPEQNVPDSPSEATPIPQINEPKRKTDSGVKCPVSGPDKDIVIAEGGLEVKIDGRRRRSLSDGQLPVSIQQVRDAVAAGQGHGLQGQPKVSPRSNTVEVAIPARDLNNTSRVGYLERKLDADWVSSWFVLKDNTLYQYAQPIDDVTQDVLQLPGYEVIPCLPQADDRHVFELIHPDEAHLTLSTDTVADCEMWMEAIHVATQKLTLDSLNLDTTNNMDAEAAKASRERLEEEARRQWQRELLKIKKQQLLREVLMQKEELTRRQHMFARSKPSSFDSALPTATAEEDLEELDEQFLRDRAILKQRKVSTQLKIDMVQKQMQASTLARTKTKRKGFKLKGLKTDKSPELDLAAVMGPVDQDLLQSQLKELTEELNNITMELEKTERKSGSSSHLSSYSSASHRRQTFGNMSSTASVDSDASSHAQLQASRERTQSDFSESKMSRSFQSDPNLLQPTPTNSSLSLQSGLLRPNSVFSPTPSSQHHHHDPFSDQGSAVDIPMIDDTPSPDTDTTKTPHAHYAAHYNRKSRHSWDLGAHTPAFTLATTTPSSGGTPGVGLMNRSQSSSGQQPLSAAVGGTPTAPPSMGGKNLMNKSCDFSLLHTPVGGGGFGGFSSSSSQHTMPRGRNEGTCAKKCEISATALAEIAAFEELVQRKMQGTPVVQ